jgi:hypothetical protein
MPPQKEKARLPGKRAPVERNEQPLCPLPDTTPMSDYRTLEGGHVSKQSEHLRDQARRAQRLALTISDDNACAKLKDMSRQFDEDAERLEKTELSAPNDTRGGFQA